MELQQNSKFCSECGTPLAPVSRSAEYKQVTVLFADVVHSMDIAAAVGAERLREIMADLVERSASVVKRYGGTVDKFTGDGLMAVFGAPFALEDHAFRACLAALAIQETVKELATEVQRRDHIDLSVRVGLNSGQVIAGEIGSGSLGYTAIGEHVGMAQRMESAAPAGEIMLSSSTAHLVEDLAVLSAAEMVDIKGAADPVPAHRLIGAVARGERLRRPASTLVGREWQLGALAGMLDQAIKGHGCVAGVVGPAGIGKSRILSELTAIATSRGVEVFSAYCESHTCDVPFYASNGLLRAAIGIEGLDASAARERVREQNPGADHADLVLLDDLLGIGDPTVAVPEVAPEARRRRVASVVNAAVLRRTTPAVFIIEDAHWIDETSESVLTEFLPVVPQTRSLTLITYRPEYRGRLSQARGGQTIALAPLDDPQTAALVAEQLGAHPSVAGLADQIVERAAGNPFFVEAIARDLADRGVIVGRPGEYVVPEDVTDISVPATLQAAIAARIDRLHSAVKRTLSAAAVIGSRFTIELLTALGVDPVLDDLIAAELIDQVRYTPCSEYAFRHPLIRDVAYEAQLKSDRAKLHRRLAAAIEAGQPESAEQNAALIAEHLDAAGDARAAYSWHMRAGEWSITRDVAAAVRSWERAGQLAEKLPHDDASTSAMRVAPRALLCANAFRVRRGGSAARFPELQELCEASGDKASLAIGMFGLLADTLDEGHVSEASQLASEHLTLLESIGDSKLTVGLSYVGILIKALSAEMADVLRWSQMTIDLAEGDPAKGNLVVDSPLALAVGARGVARYWLGLPGWRVDLDDAWARARTGDALSCATVGAYKYDLALFAGVVRSDDSALRAIGESLQICEQSGDDFALAQARMSMGSALIHHDSADSGRGVALLEQVRDQILQGGFSLAEVPMLNLYIDRERARRGHRDAALPSMREAVDLLFSRRHHTYCLGATGMLVETLLEADTSELSEVEAAIDRLAASVEEHQPLRDIMVLRLRTLLAKACRDDAAYRDLRARYRAMANLLGYEGHMAWAEAMP